MSKISIKGLVIQRFQIKHFHRIIIQEILIQLVKLNLKNVPEHLQEFLKLITLLQSIHQYFIHKKVDNS